jgi:hypothetical protein
MINVDSWVEIEPGTPISHEVRILDRNAEVVIGPSLGRTSVIRLLVSDPVQCAQLARAFSRAGAELAAGLRAV